MKLFALCLFIITSAPLRSEIPAYESTDNTGINKLERIDVIEKYLINISGSLKGLEAKVDANVIKISSLEKLVSQIKDSDIKNIEKKLAENDIPSKTPEMDELNKLQSDLTTLKNEDIESIRMQIQVIKSSVQLLQSQIK